MALSRRRFITISAVAGAGALLPRAARASTETVRWSGTAMGATASLTLAGVKRGDAERLITRTRAEIERMERIFSLYRADSAIVRLNRQGRLHAPPFEFLDVLSKTKAIHEVTGGAFDPTIQPVWALLAESGGKPDSALLLQARSLVGFSGLHFDNSRVAFARPGMAITLNGIAQGYATDSVAGLLRAAGFENVLVAVGEIAALGRRSSSQPWRVGIAEREDGEPEETIALEDAAIATTAPKGTVFDADGKLGHLVDPTRGMASSPWRRISVVHSSATMADGLSTGFAFLTEAEMRRALASFPGSRVIARSWDGRRLDLSA